ncbi:MAG: hypothetical protein PQJ46_13010, partial [Spirochaetales bacterium]|nr:hypothetical protein [Spirochaetales bacterium]
MNNNKSIYFTIILIFIGLLLSGFGYYFITSIVYADPDSSEINYSFESGKTLTLNNIWEVYSDRGLTRKTHLKNGVFIKGSYYLTCKIKTKDMKGLNAFMINPVYSAYELWVNGQLIAVNGTPEKKIEKPGRPSVVVVPFEQKGDILNIVFHVSNNSHCYGGSLLNWISYGRFNDIEKRAQHGRELDWLIFFGLFLFSIIHLFNYFYHQSKALSSLFFFGYMFCYALLALFTGRVIISSFFSFLPAVVLFKMELILFVIPLYFVFLFLSSLFPCEINRNIVVASGLVSSLLVLVSILIPLNYSNIILATVICAKFIGIIFLLQRLITAFFRKRVSAGAACLSFAVFALCLLNDILIPFGVYPSVRLMWVGLFVFAIQQTYRLVSDNIAERIYSVKNSAKLEMIMNQKDYFFTTNSESLSKPVSNVVGLGESLLRGSIGPLNSEQIATLSLIVSNASMVSNSLNDILDFTYIKNNSLKLNITGVDIFKAVTRVLNNCEALVITSLINLKLEVSRNAGIVAADERRLEQILYSLVSNSIKHISTGEIIAKSKETENGIEVSFIINGSDFDDEKILSLLNIYNKGIEDGFEDKMVAELG